ncbi:glycosyltransferase [Conexibacter sp. SYSU D00693]|uniref:glycosyltransferase n=1 Tax=Conexibacter sp. SYSU D00693 TaxID=2812560 RepID=UPI00196AA02F|nr:nucleotide disphospho-sugar-binding domain-containing protein [Conexibacter sp. SYSU D00693]
MRVLAYTSPARGHLFPLVAIAQELRRRGHDVAVRTLAAEVDRLRALGFAAAPIAPAIEALEHDDHAARSPIGGLRRSLATFARRAPHEVDDLRGAIAQQRPDVVLVDCAAWGASAAAEAWGGPWAQWFPYPLPLSAPDVPPFGPGFAPAAGPLGRLRDRVVGPPLLRVLERASLPRFNPVRVAAGAPPFRRADDMWTAAPLLLHLSAEPFEHPRAHWPPNVRLVGPCAWDPPGEDPPWLAALGDRPLVLVTTSSEFQDDGRLVRTALDALAEEDVDVVATLPSAQLDGPIPPNARVERFVPHGPLLGRAACAVTHGGAGATQKALAAGVPVCVVPFGRDQLEVASRVEGCQAGVRLPRRRLGAARLRAAVHEAIARRDGAARVARAFADAGGPPAAADHLEALAARHDAL